VGARDVEAILLEQGVTDIPLAGRLARISGGRPGVALAYARSPDAVRARGELTRGFLDLLGASPAARLAAIRGASPTALEMVDALDAGAALASTHADDAPASRSTPGASRGKGRPSGTTHRVAPGADPQVDDESLDDLPGKAVPAARRRRAAEALIAVWMDVTRDLALVVVDGARSVRDPALLDESLAAAAGLPPDGPAAFLLRLARGAELVAANVSPELVLDSLALAWPKRRAA
jgi:hypothetical protein